MVLHSSRASEKSRARLFHWTWGKSLFRKVAPYPPPNPIWSVGEDDRIAISFGLRFVAEGNRSSLASLPGCGQRVPHPTSVECEGSLAVYELTSPLLALHRHDCTA